MRGRGDIGGLPEGKYGLILADPAWSFKTFSAKGEGKSPQQHYSCMPLEAIKAMREAVLDVAAKDCALVMWATFPMLPQALEVMESWGFKYKSGGLWHKKTKHGKTAFGTGFMFRSAAEIFLVGTRGKPRIKNRRTRNLIEAPVREHSRKPDEMVTMVESLFDGPYLELFARTTRPGWTAWGNETEKFA